MAQLAIEIEDCFQTANAIAHEQGALFWELRIALSLARLLMTQGRHDKVTQHLAPVYGRFTEEFDMPDLRSARALRDRPSPWRMFLFHWACQNLTHVSRSIRKMIDYRAGLNAPAATG